jgi:hypothetical protein
MIYVHGGRKPFIWSNNNKNLEYRLDRKSMFLSIMSTTSAMSAFTTPGVAEVSVAAVICLIVLLSASEILSASKLWNKHLAHSLNLAILPLVVTFFAIVAFNIIKVL